jgi:hypothetical protein
MDGSGLLAVDQLELEQAQVDGVLDRSFSLAKIDAVTCGAAPRSLDA